MALRWQRYGNVTATREQRAGHVMTTRWQCNGHMMATCHAIMPHVGKMLAWRWQRNDSEDDCERYYGGSDVDGAGGGDGDDVDGDGDSDGEGGNGDGDANGDGGDAGIERAAVDRGALNKNRTPTHAPNLQQPAPNSSRRPAPRGANYPTACGAPAPVH